MKGLVTGTKALVLDGGCTYLTATTYYNEKYRPIQVLRDLYDLNEMVEITSNRYDFIGQLVETKTSHVTETDTTEIIKFYSNDHMGRLLKIRQEANDTTVVLSEMEYNDLGQLDEKKLHVSGSTALQTINYEYNIRGWLTSINDPTDLSGDLFGMDLCYNDITRVSGLTTLAQYNGNISGTRWKSEGDSYIKGYGYSYDGLNRLTSSDYGEGSSFSNNQDRYRESIGSYDLMGNIISLTRYDSIMIDSLLYNYTGNQLNKIEDRADTTKGFIDSTNDADYQYDLNGNLTKDLNKGISIIEYNYLNLPSKVKKDGIDSILFIYDAMGTKLKKISIESNSPIPRYYAGVFEYDNNRDLKMIHNEEGIVNVSNNNEEFIYDYEYYLKDHLGNTRVTFIGNTPQQTIDYYPFGMIINSSSLSGANKYFYNGKEFQDDLIDGKNLDWYDYGARFYDAQIGRWTTIDPSAEEMKDMSPYNYCGNNPVSRMDPDGRKYLNDNDKRISEQSISSLDNENGRLDKSNQRLQKHIDSGKLNEDRTKKAEAKITENKKLIKENEASIKAFTTMGDEKVETIFTFKAVSVPHDPNRWESQTTIVSHPYLTIIDGQKVNVLEYSSTSNRVHEARHGLQILQGRLNLGRVENGRRYFSPNDIAETEAYRAEYASCGSLSLPNVTVESIDDINPSMWKDAKDNKGNTVYQ